MECKIWLSWIRWVSETFRRDRTTRKTAQLGWRWSCWMAQWRPQLHSIPAAKFLVYTYHIISYHIISYHIISYHIISYHIISYHIISYHIISYHIIITNVTAKQYVNMLSWSKSITGKTQDQPQYHVYYQRVQVVGKKQYVFLAFSEKNFSGVQNSPPRKRWGKTPLNS